MNLRSDAYTLLQLRAGDLLRSNSATRNCENREPENSSRLVNASLSVLSNTAALIEAVHWPGNSHVRFVYSPSPSTSPRDRLFLSPNGIPASPNTPAATSSVSD